MLAALTRYQDALFEWPQVTVGRSYLFGKREEVTVHAHDRLSFRGFLV